MSIRLFTDGSHRAIQAEVLANRLEPIWNSPHDLIISCGIDSAEKAIAAKKASGAKLISVLDPTKHHAEFDLIIAPIHDPLPPGENVITTYGLINPITPEMLSLLDVSQFHSLPSPRVAVLLGGYHVGGNVSEADAIRLSELVNSIGGSALITSSQRTEYKASEALEANIIIPKFFWDYNREGRVNNPYMKILAAADIIIVTADSVRMCSEACSSGKNVIIFTPEKLHFSYNNLRKSLVSAGYASDGEVIETKRLNESERIAKIICAKFQAC